MELRVCLRAMVVDRGVDSLNRLLGHLSGDVEPVADEPRGDRSSRLLGVFEQPLVDHRQRIDAANRRRDRGEVGGCEMPSVVQGNVVADGQRCRNGIRTPDRHDRTGRTGPHRTPERHQERGTGVLPEPTAVTAALVQQFAGSISEFARSEFALAVRVEVWRRQPTPPQLGQDLVVEIDQRPCLEVAVRIVRTRSDQVRLRSGVEAQSVEEARHRRGATPVHTEHHDAGRPRHS